MPLESPVDHLDDLDENNPAHTDGLSFQDDHSRNIKKALKQTFPGAGGAGFATPIVAHEADINALLNSASPAAITLVGTDQLVINDGGVLKQISLTTLDAYRRAVVETMTGKTLTSPVLDGSLSGTAFLDDDSMSADSAVAVASQQSIKAYVDSQIKSVRLATPALLLNSAADNTTWTVGSSSVLTSNNASRAILKAQCLIEGSAGGGAVQRAAVWLGPGGKTGTADWNTGGSHRYWVAAGAYTGNGNPEYSFGTAEVEVDLDASHQFAYARGSDGTPASVSYQIYLMGYYL
jgi:hypothetical protein